MDAGNVVLVTGATGNVGSMLVQKLAAKGVSVRALVRDSSKTDAIGTSGVDIVIGDLDQPETLDAAAQGVNGIYLLTWNGPTAKEHAANLISAVRRAGGNPHIVRQSAYGSAKSRLIQDHIAIDKMISNSGLPFTLLRPTWFVQNAMMAAQTVATDGLIYMPFKNGRVGMIDVRDIADAAAEVLTSDGHVGKSYVLTGPAPASFHDVAAALTSALGKSVTYVDVPLEAGKQAMLAMGLPEWIVDGYLELIEDFADDWGNHVSPDLEMVLGRSGTTVEQFAADFADVFGGRAGVAV